LKTLRAQHLKSQYSEGYPEYQAVRYEASSDGVLPRDFLEDTIRQHGTRLKLFIHS
jgi:hypothetical protein